MTVFMGIETPEEAALAAMEKKQNLRKPILGAIEELNRHGLEVVSGIILGLDTDTPATGGNILRFIEASQVPLLTINLLYALPKTPLYDRLERAGRLLPDQIAAERLSNIEFLMPYDDVVRMWFDTVTTAYEPANLFRRFRYQTEHTFPNRKIRQPEASWSMVRYGLSVMGRVLWHCGITANWRRQFWELCWPLVLQGRIDEVIHIGVVTYHLLNFTRDIREGRWEAAFYASSDGAAAAPGAMASPHPVGIGDG
jgi:radical SAM superfamily enzyme YgiQ (UPF0313 family)